MNEKELLAQVALGEDSSRQFKVNFTSPDKLAAEMAAFANSEGGTIYIGVANDGSTPGLGSDEVERLNQMIANVASQNIKSPITVSTENIKVSNGNLLIVVRVPRVKANPIS